MSFIDKLSIPLGVLNATWNILLWLLVTVSAIVSERVYMRVASWECARSGLTKNTDATEINAVTWLFAEQRKRRRQPSWWVILLGLLNLSLLPLEILTESGIDEYKRCYPKTVQSVGVCSSPWTSRNVQICSSSSVLTKQFDWVDKEWDCVLEGQSKLPNAQDVHVERNLKKKDRRFLAKSCNISYGECAAVGQKCGEMTINPGSNAVAVINWTFAPPKEKLYGSVGRNPSLTTAFLFWATATLPTPEKNFENRSRIVVAGLEMILKQEEAEKVVVLDHDADEKTGHDRHHHPSMVHLKIHSNRTKTYSIACTTDGVPASDLARAISMYRRGTREAPSATIRGFQNISRASIPSLTRTDVVKAIYALKMADTDSKCTGQVELYSTCGYLKREFVLPFVCLVAVIVCGWIIIACTLPKAEAKVPVDILSWRKRAMELMRRQKQTLRDREVINEEVGDDLQQEQHESSTVETISERNFIIRFSDLPGARR